MTQASPFDTKYAWLRMMLTLLIGVTGNVGMWVYVVTMPGVEAEFDITRAQASLPFVTTMIGFALGNLLLGRLMDRFGIAQTLAAAAVLMALGYGLASLAPGLVWLSVLQLVIGFGTASCFGPLIADVSLWFHRYRGIAVAITASGNYLSGALLPLGLSLFAVTPDWRWTYLGLGALILATVLPLSMLLRRRVPAEAIAQSETQSAARARATGLSPRALQYVLGLAGIACCVAMSMPQVHIVSLCVDMGFGAAAGAEMLSLMLFGGVASRLAFGLLADRLGGLRTLLIGSTLQTIALCLYLPAGTMSSLYVVSLVFGLSQGGIVPSYAMIVRELMPAREAGARVGFVMMATIFGMALGGWLSGLIYELSGSYQLAFLNGIAWNAVNIAIAVALVISAKKPRGALSAT